ncbi:hypothetical protein DESC_480069 [Desulfosarcina cetonica]|nr:hypothetical protein DESC_480069 [Desulfosarcina cetonica]
MGSRGTWSIPNVPSDPLPEIGALCGDERVKKAGNLILDISDKINEL